MPSLVHLDSDSDSESESLADSVTDILSAIASDDSDASYDPDFEFSPGKRHKALDSTLGYAQD